MLACAIIIMMSWKREQEEGRSAWEEMQWTKNLRTWHPKEPRVWLEHRVRLRLVRGPFRGTPSVPVPQSYLIKLVAKALVLALIEVLDCWLGG